jgi:hypothetical protein
MKSKLILGLLLSMTAMAQEGGRKKPPRPSQEVMEKMKAACVDKAKDAFCSFEGRQGKSVEGTCQNPPKGKEGPLGCKPDHPPGPPPKQQ